MWGGDCREVMRSLPDASVDAVVTDPPYELAFKGKGWDSTGIAYDPTVWGEALRVLKPGGHLLAFGGTRTWHRLAVAIEDAGFEIRDSIAWIYGSGFPKSLDVSKAIDRKRYDREDVLRVTGEIARLRDVAGLSNRDLDEVFGFAGMAGHWTSVKRQPCIPTVQQWSILRDMLHPDEWLDAEVWRLNGRKGHLGEAWTEREVTGQHDTPAAAEQWNARYGLPANLTAKERRDKPATPAAQQWEGWGTALKPAHEPIVVARKPLIGTVAENVLAHGTGALNIDGCRIGTEQRVAASTSSAPCAGDRLSAPGTAEARRGTQGPPKLYEGRWPGNVILDESQAEELDRQSGMLKSGANPTKRSSDKFRDVYGDFTGQAECVPARGADTGGASRFFYVPKAGSAERPRDGNTAHPTVKPLDLMRYLVRLVTPPNGRILDPFAGSGTTLEAAIIEGFHATGVEQDPTYLPLIRQRLTKPIQPVMW